MDFIIPKKYIEISNVFRNGKWWWWGGGCTNVIIGVMQIISIFVIIYGSHIEWKTWKRKMVIEKS